MYASHQGLSAISWKSYQLIKKKAMEQELSWSGLIVSLSIAFFIVLTCAGFLRIAYNSIENNTDAAKQFNGERLIQSGALVKIFINSANAASLDFKATPVKETIYLTLEPGQSSTQKIKFKNTGKDTWKLGEVNLETGPYLKSFSRLETTAWLKFYRPAKLTKEIKSGQTVELAFPIKAPTDLEGTIQENFQLVRAERPIPGSLVRIFVTVAKKSSATVSSPSVTQNQIKSSTAVAAPMVTANVTNTDFCLAMINDASAYENCNTNKQESVLENGIIFQKLLNQEPAIRVGLFNSSLTQRLSYNTSFDIYSGSEILFSGVGANEIVSVNYNPTSRGYAVTLATTSKTTASPIRFVPRTADGVATMLDYKNSPAWNKTTSDNRFRNVIEVRYTEPAKKVWYINELPLESYLKGLAETTNASPLEFQKVMATAARSYAMYHYLRGIEYNLIDASTKHADDHFHVDAYYDQVYRGYNSEIRMPGLSAAIEATRGVTVAYAG
ncbi:MAG: SpoIID/LytB domain-containing protein, partial [Candidatus Shapirobacteria bacterium]